VELWQYTDAGSVPGISATVDLNLCLVDYHAPAEPEPET
jgi:GH25 family lysozyme M1 (1,4-beta-N-acetylmuramidase)